MSNIRHLAELQAEEQADDHAVDQFSDVENMYRFWQIAGDDLLFVTGIGWHAWQEGRWLLDQHEAVRIGQRIGSQVAKELQEKLELYQPETDKATRDGLHREIDKFNRHIKHSESLNAITSAIRLAESTKPAAAQNLDRNAWLFTCANGTLNLKTGLLQEPNRLDYITKASPIAYDPGAQCPLWETTLLEIFQGKTHIIKFLQRWFGYCLTGCINEQVLVVFFGEGSNGKDVILNRIRKAMGEYCGEIAPDLLTQSRNEQHPTAMFDLRGRRLGISSETGEGRPLDETRVKQITGGERLKARGMRQDFVEFDNETKIALQTNHLPEIKGDDYAIWRRIRLVPFNRIFTESERDERLGQRLDDTELPGILRWLVEGCTEWQRTGLKPPDEIIQATAGYRSDQDVLREFFEAECEFGRTKQAASSAIWKRWREWCKDNDQQPNSQKWLAPRIQRKGCIKRRTMNGAIYDGISLKNQTKHDGYDG